MQDNSKKRRTFYFQAGTSTVGGTITGQTFEPGASAMVPSVGGASKAQRDGLEAVDSIISFGPTDANGSGGEQESTGLGGEKRRHWTVEVTSTVNNLNILSGKVQAAAITTLGKATYQQDRKPEVTFAGSAITGLTVNGCSVTVSFKKGIDICGEEYGDCLPQQICIVDSVKVEGKCPGIEKLDDHTLHVAGVGTLIFGEGVKFPNGPVQVCLLRIELDTSTKTGAGGAELRAESVTPQDGNGTATTGTVSVGAGVVGGSPMPP
jgi:hypothetical protein